MAQTGRERWLDALAASPTCAVWAMSLGLLALAAGSDWLSSAEIAASLGYLLPVAVAAWARGRNTAVAVALLCAVTWLLIEAATHDGSLADGTATSNFVVLLMTFLLIGQLLASLRARLDQERRLARTDPLTALPNRRALWDALAVEAERGRRHGEPFSLVYIDVDGFKQVNDRHGHRVGDELLCRIAATLRLDRRQLDLVARVGGDEFVLLMPHTGVFGAAKALQRLEQRLRAAPFRSAYAIDFSIGCLTVADVPDDIGSIVAGADRLMYEVKRAGHHRLRHEVLGTGAGAQRATALRPARVAN